MNSHKQICSSRGYRDLTEEECRSLQLKNCQGKTGNDNNLINENYFALRLGVSLNDIWFIKRKYN